MILFFTQYLRNGRNGWLQLRQRLETQSKLKLGTWPSFLTTTGRAKHFSMQYSARRSITLSSQLAMNCFITPYFRCLIDLRANMACYLILYHGYGSKLFFFTANLVKIRLKPWGNSSFIYFSYASTPQRNLIEHNLIL